ncbi:hypothetical protein IST455A_05795 [Burkholderia multivorans]|nr:hypothetical protein IST419_05809 [Burkholderia multivorans]CAB5311496.1 hypothetical protein IST424_05794 [Burkholderia multivorans]CAB5313104.1 hypothetical protein IST455A_05795 [Burkholderia multivorans]CAB5313262.1 hypothetical protein IST453_05816 [Burkholderia multivorans]CAB5314686.1 hypothetical protein IST455B_05795 [Burkholderia multivorans]
MSMSTSLTSVTLAGCLAWSLAACSSSPPKPVLPDGLHRVPVNRVPPGRDGQTTVPTAPPPVPDGPAAPDTGDRS